MNKKKFLIVKIHKPNHQPKIYQEKKRLWITNTRSTLNTKISGKNKEPLESVDQHTTTSSIFQFCTQIEDMAMLTVKLIFFLVCSFVELISYKKKPLGLSFKNSPKSNRVHELGFLSPDGTFPYFFSARSLILELQGEITSSESLLQILHL